MPRLHMWVHSGTYGAPLFVFPSSFRRSLVKASHSCCHIFLASSTAGDEKYVKITVSYWRNNSSLLTREVQRLCYAPTRVLSHCSVPVAAVAGGGEVWGGLEGAGQA